jgi:geranylgeranyl pyrophosphate synthase
MSTIPKTRVGAGLHGESLLGVVEERMTEIVHASLAGLAGLIERRSDSTRAAAYHLSSGGRRIRAKLALSAGTALGLPPEDSVAIASCVELIHNASLVHDDMEDRQQFRRGVETVHAAYGFHVALCSGDLLLSAAYAALARFSNVLLLPELLSLVHARVAVVIGGQCARLVPIGDEDRDMTAYDAIASAKSGALLSLPLELALKGSSKGMWSEDARRAAEHFAIGYQIADDMEDLEQDRENLSVNALLVIEAASRCQINEALDIARSHALKHLNKAGSLAGSLPNGSGGLLRKLAQELSHRLEGMH